MNTTRIWDLPTRLFHWLLVGAVVTTFLSSGDSRWLYLHLVSGSVAGGLVVFRLFWGVAGSRHARFTDFVRGGAAVLGHLKAVAQGRATPAAGHNPTGGWMILLLLAAVGIIVLLGWSALGGLENGGWLAPWIDVATGALLARWHETLAWSLLGAAAIHVGGVIVESRLLRQNLTAAMVSGHKPLDETTSVPNHGGVASLMILALLAGVGTALTPWATATQERPFIPFSGPPLPDDKVWQQECAPCHLAFAPSLLPARSWRRMLAEQHDHFGEDLDLDAATLGHLEIFLVAGAAETLPTGATYKLARGLSADQAPQRITELPFWKARHQEIPESVWRDRAVHSASRCQACHLDGAAGTFHAAAMHIPPQALETNP